LVSELVTHSDFHSSHLGEKRVALVYLPPGYRRDTRRQYPLLLLHDGQNVFDGSTSYVSGEYWRVREAADQLIAARKIEPVVIAAFYHGGAKRVFEYTPTRTVKLGGGGAALHARAVLEELLPFLRARYRLLPHARHTGLGGSSLGGLVTLWLGLEHPEVFGKLGVMSPSAWWSARYILRRVQAIQHPQRQRLWLDVGTQEGATPLFSVRDVRLLKAMLVTKGWREGRNLHYAEVEGAGHSERAWAERVPEMLKFLYPRKAAHAHRS
jgi:enterochelin esterase-like enzyme